MPKPKPTQAKPQLNYHLAIVVAISAVALALLVAVIYIYNQDDLVNGSATVNITNTNDAVVSNTNNGNSKTNLNVITTTSNWLTYTNSKYKYSVKIPNGWTDENTSDANPSMFADPVAVAQTEAASLLQGSKIEIVVDQNVSAALQAFASGQDQEGDILSEANMTVAGVPGIWRAVNGPLGYYNVFYLKNGTSIYRIIQYIPKVEDRGLYTAIYDQVLSSFTFPLDK